MPTFTQCLIDVDPLFVQGLDPDDAPSTAGDFRVQICSPAIDAGMTGVNMESTDLAGEAREQGNAIDIGAYESMLESYASGTVTRQGPQHLLLSWFAPGEWSTLAVPTPCQDVIITDGYQVRLFSPNVGRGRTLEVAGGAVLEVDAGAELEIGVE